MAKMTISSLAQAMTTYVDYAKQAGAWNATQNNFVGLLDKIGKQITIDGTFFDKLPEMEGDNLPLGKTVEEFFIDLTLSTSYTDAATEGAKDEEPALPTVEDVSYSYTLGKQKVKTTILFNDWERAMISSEGAANIGAKVLERLQNSYDLTRYQEKKQLLGNVAKKYSEDIGSPTVAIPVDTATGEAFIKQVKADVEAASFAHMGDCLAGANVLIGAAPELVLYVKKGVMPSIEVDTLAGAFNREDLALPCKIKVLDDFGDDDGNEVWAILMDPRGVKLHNSYNAVRVRENADGDFINYVRHWEDTGFISKYTYVKCYSSL